jgi:chemotaxis methyl-accepting protein methylase
VVRAWDLGCGTGESTISLARALACRACGRTRVDVLGTTPSSWELLMATRRGRPHDRARTLELRAASSKIDEDPAILVRFSKADAREPSAAPTGCDIVFAGGVLGGVLFDRDEIARALQSIAVALAPGGRAYVVDRFRADRAERARVLISELAPAAGLFEAAPGELMRATYREWVSRCRTSSSC